MIRDISGFSNPLVKRLRSLREKKHRKREGLFLAEGLRILIEARDVSVLPDILVISDDARPHPLAEELIEETLAAGGDVIRTGVEILSKITAKDNPQAVVGVYRDCPTALSAVDRHSAPIWFVAQAMRDPGNLGTLMRIGDAVGAGGVILIDDCVDPFSVETVRASMGALFTQAIVPTDWTKFLGWLREGQGQLVGTSLNASVDYQEPHYTAPTFLLIGNEARGLPPEYEEACDVRVKIPMLGRADSLNASVAAAVMAYEVVNQSKARGSQGE
ncbi:MAG TPA: RNA methyltransferase [Sphingobium sp.]|uniref:TrmH family RNA methyltransferase n=1 Tax=Sphingobium sp. TaxID=1912891 RepID=UPI002ED0FF64